MDEIDEEERTRVAFAVADGRSEVGLAALALAAGLRPRRARGERPSQGWMPQ